MGRKSSSKRKQGRTTEQAVQAPVTAVHAVVRETVPAPAQVQPAQTQVSPAQSASAEERSERSSSVEERSERPSVIPPETLRAYDDLVSSPAAVLQSLRIRVPAALAERIRRSSSLPPPPSAQ